MPGLLSMADAHAASSVLVVAQKPTAISDRVVAEVRPFFRVRLISARILEEISRDPLRAIESLNDHLDVEEHWCAALQPASTRDPLLLPASSFSAQSKYQDAWRAAATAASVIQIADVGRYIAEFETAHRRAGGSGVSSHFECASDLRWDHSGARHAQAPFPMFWKFSYRLPDGFHYDVTSSRGKAFAVTDHERRVHRRSDGEHVNIDPHGRVR